jgi:hypothetical protein
MATVDAESVESQPLFTGERFSTERSLGKFKDSAVGWHIASFAPVSALSCACVRLDTCPERRTMKKQQQLEIASKEEKEKTGKIYGVLGS